jgi:hypothetical protein
MIERTKGGKNSAIHASFIHSIIYFLRKELWQNGQNKRKWDQFNHQLLFQVIKMLGVMTRLNTIAYKFCCCKGVRKNR